MSSRRAQLTQSFEALGQVVLEGPGEASPAVRQAAAVGKGEGALGDYVRQVQAAADRVTPGQVEALRRTHSDDVLFEVTVAAAYGAAKQRHEAGLRALDAAWEDEP